MFGKNQILKAEIHSGTSLKIVEIFATIQGEGPFAGTPAIFVRLGGCNLACEFCDTNFDDFKTIKVSDILLEVKKLAKNSTKLVVITGGEPLRQPLKKLCDELLANNFKVQIETNGTLFQDLDDQISIICSPKVSNNKYHKIRADLLPKITAFKFIISKSNTAYNDVIDLGQEQYKIPVYLQPMDQYDSNKNQENIKLTTKLCQKYGYNLSLQIHKILGLR